MKTEYPDATLYAVDGPCMNEVFIFEKIGTDDKGNGKYRIWAAHSGRQLRSSYNSSYQKNILVQGSYDDKDSKGNEYKDQIFTVIENKDGSLYIKDYQGKYLTMAYGDNAVDYPFVFEDYANGDSKQKVAARQIEETFHAARNGSKKYGVFGW